MAICVLGQKKHTLAWYYENNVIRTDELKYKGPDIKKISTTLLQKIKAFVFQKEFNQEHTMRCHKWVLVKFPCKTELLFQAQYSTPMIVLWEAVL